MKTSITIKDSLDIQDGILKVQHNSARMIGEVIIEEIDPLGNVVFSSIEKNDLTIAGATFILEQLFKKKSTNIRFNLSGDNITENLVTEPLNDSDLYDEQIFGFMIGIGGEDGVSVKAPNFTSTKLDKFIPFRSHIKDDVYSSGDISTSDYSLLLPFGDNNEGYYVKKFTKEVTADEKAINRVDVDIIPEYTDGSGAVTNNNINTTNSPIYTYAKMILDIDTKDVREYFRLTDGPLNNCRINQLGLVAGKPNGVDNWTDVKLVTILNFKGRYLNNDENTIKFRYKIYCM